MNKRYKEYCLNQIKLIEKRFRDGNPDFGDKRRLIKLKKIIENEMPVNKW